MRGIQVITQRVNKYKKKEIKKKKKKEKGRDEKIKREN
jgi:hypothetical protein